VRAREGQGPGRLLAQEGDALPHPLVAVPGREGHGGGERAIGRLTIAEGSEGSSGGGGDLGVTALPRLDEGQQENLARPRHRGLTVARGLADAQICPANLEHARGHSRADDGTVCLLPGLLGRPRVASHEPGFGARERLAPAGVRARPSRL